MTGSVPMETKSLPMEGNLRFSLRLRPSGFQAVAADGLHDAIPQHADLFMGQILCRIFRPELFRGE